MMSGKKTGRRRYFVAVATAALLALAGTAQAQQACPSAAASVDKVTRVTPPELHRNQVEDKEEARVELEDVIDVHVVGLKDLLAERDCRKQTQANKALVLYLAGLPLSDRTGILPGPPETGIMRFQLVRTTATKDNWARILGRPVLEPRNVSVSVGFADQYPVPSSAIMALRILPAMEFALTAAFLLALSIAFIVCVQYSNILRDAAADGSGQPGAYSLAKTQAAWWFFTIFTSYLLIAVVTGEFDSALNGTALALLGIGTATAIGSAVVGNSQAAGDAGAAQRSAAATIEASADSLRDDVAAARARLAAATTDAERAAAAADLARAQATLARARMLFKRLTHRSIDFLRDILSDSNGVSFHRFQMAGWTLVLSFIFIKEVWEKLAMPDFDGNLLALQGISAATYLGLKMTEPAVPAAVRS